MKWLLLTSMFIIFQGCITSNVDKLQKQTVMAQVEAVKSANQNLIKFFDTNIQRYQEALELHRETLSNTYMAEHYKLLRYLQQKKDLDLYEKIRRASLFKYSEIMSKYQGVEEKFLSIVARLPEEDLEYKTIDGSAEKEDDFDVADRLWRTKIKDEVGESDLKITKDNLLSTFGEISSEIQRNVFDADLVVQVYNAMFLKTSNLAASIMSAGNSPAATVSLDIPAVEVNGGRILRAALYIQRNNNQKAKIREGEDEVLRAIEVVASYLSPDEEINLEELINLANLSYQIYKKAKENKESNNAK